MKFLELLTSDCGNIESFFDLYQAKTADLFRMKALEASLVCANEFSVPGFCLICNRPSKFIVDFKYSYLVDGSLTPNWRERLECPICGLNNRMRASLGMLKSHAGPQSSVYLTEQTTPLFAAAKEFFYSVEGSEYIHDGTQPGQCNAAGIRSEDVTNLSFLDNSFDVIGSFDVLEHVPDYQQGLHEFLRCLKPDGRIYLTVPVSLDSYHTARRAFITPTGKVAHILPPEYHGDPLNSEGVLCFYNFGWDILDRMKEAGFYNPKIKFYWSMTLGHLGGLQSMISAVKPPA